MSNKTPEELIRDGDLTEAQTEQRVLLDPGEYKYLHGEPGKEYAVIAVNIDSEYTAYIGVWTSNQGWLANNLSVEPDAARKFHIPKMPSDGVFLNNQSNAQAPRRPKVVFILAQI